MLVMVDLAGRIYRSPDLKRMEYLASGILFHFRAVWRVRRRARGM
jgi:hypothetical protein